jgi:hypothetical protein
MVPAYMNLNGQGEEAVALSTLGIGCEVVDMVVSQSCAVVGAEIRNRHAFIANGANSPIVIDVRQGPAAGTTIEALGDWAKAYNHALGLAQRAPIHRDYRNRSAHFAGGFGVSRERAGGFCGNSERRR